MAGWWSYWLASRLSRNLNGCCSRQNVNGYKWLQLPFHVYSLYYTDLQDQNMQRSLCVTHMLFPLKVKQCRLKKNLILLFTFTNYVFTFAITFSNTLSQLWTLCVKSDFIMDEGDITHWRSQRWLCDTVGCRSQIEISAIRPSVSTLRTIDYRFFVWKAQ